MEKSSEVGAAKLHDVGTEVPNDVRIKILNAVDAKASNVVATLTDLKREISIIYTALHYLYGDNLFCLEYPYEGKVQREYYSDYETLIKNLRYRQQYCKWVKAYEIIDWNSQKAISQ